MRSSDRLRLPIQSLRISGLWVVRRLPQSEECQLLVHKVALRHDRHVKIPAAELLHEFRSVPVSGEQYQAKAGWREMLRQARREALGDVYRSSGAIRIVPRRAADERGIE